MERRFVPGTDRGCVTVSGGAAVPAGAIILLRRRISGYAAVQDAKRSGRLVRIFLAELVYTSGSVHDLLLAGEERVTL